ncbi:MAG: thioredoxin family protein [Candidatus Hydrogenedentes bacterium]|nr:thioredoxin family protein [Candidatus Hydrogenedentota bacterium]
MGLTPSTMVKLGTPAPDFELLDTEGNIVSRADFTSSKGLLVMFICNHCPYVKHVREELVRLAKEYQAKGIGIVAISSNDADHYHEDGPEMMAQTAATFGFTFPYLYDDTQEVAKAYQAACTPDFFLYDHNHRLCYRGQLDDSRPGNDVPVTGKDLREAIDGLVTGKTISGKQKPSMGCNIKWKAGNAPSYA